jgi:hypothetical protein
MNLDAAREAYEAAMLAGVMVMAADAPGDVDAILDGQVDDTAYASMAAFARRVGRACTPHVMASHLHLDKRRADPEPSRVEVIAYQAFITVLLDLDDLKMTIAAEKARAAAQAQPVAPTPIEDTILEEVDGFFTPTW